MFSKNVSSYLDTILKNVKDIRFNNPEFLHTFECEYYPIHDEFRCWKKKNIKTHQISEYDLNGIRAIHRKRWEKTDISIPQRIKNTYKNIKQEVKQIEQESPRDKFNCGIIFQQHGAVLDCGFRFI